MAEVHANPVFVVVLLQQSGRKVSPEVGVGSDVAHLVSSASFKLYHFSPKLCKVVGRSRAKNDAANLKNPYTLEGLIPVEDIFST
jgi:hypothetical protein